MSRNAANQTFSQIRKSWPENGAFAFGKRSSWGEIVDLRVKKKIHVME